MERQMYKGITLRDARNTCIVLGLNPCHWRNLKLAAEIVALIRI